MQGENLLLSIGPLVEGTVIQRPSKHIKSPFVADVSILENTMKREILAHSASLGCGGMAEQDATVLMTKLSASDKNSLENSENSENSENKKCSHRICLSIVRDCDHPGEECVVGIYPKLAEQLAEAALKGGFLSSLQNPKSFRRETVIKIKDKVDSRFDFTGMEEAGVPFILEIKNVPIANYEEIPQAKKVKTTTKTSKKKMQELHDYKSFPFGSKVAYFPEGYRKKSTDTVSPRALKHVKELTFIKTETTPEKPIRCILCFVVQRDDVERFQPCSFDPEYKEAVQIAKNSGVEIIAMVVKWNKNGNATFIRDDLPICF
jgi:DNA-binding sugar fermentation-stimulating protein